MKVLDWHDLLLEPGILREPGSDTGRIVIWLSGEARDGFRHWDRVGSVARGEVAVGDGLAWTPATTTRGRQRLRGFVGKLMGRLGEPKGKRTLVLPDGGTVELEGDRDADCLLAWDEAPVAELAEDRVRSRWPDARRYRRLGPRLFLVEGVAGPAAPANRPAPTGDPPPQDASPRQHAERVLADARRSGDRPGEATAMADLGVILLNEGKPREAVGMLEQAMAIAGPLGDPVRAGDIASNLGLALLYVQQADRARPLLEQEMARARATGDILAEKMAAERLGLAASAIGDAQGALNWFERGLALTRRAGDRHQEAGLLWLQAIQLAELDQRDAAIARGQEAIAMFTKLGKPQAASYGAYLQKYRMGLFDGGPPPPAPGTTPGLTDYLGGALVAGVMAANPPAAARSPANSQGTTGPGLLRMALSAVRSMGQFAGSGFKMSAPDVQRRRIETCNSCEHHTGVRCKICGCFTSAKSRLQHESCPIGKWPA